jgi:RHS repeat-associated protein
VTLTLEPSLAWLQDSARVYPVLLDPTLQTATTNPQEAAAKDTYINQASTSTNYGSATTFTVGKDSVANQQDALLWFDPMSTIPQYSRIVRATLKLYASSGTASMPVNVYANLSTWDEGTVNWSSAPTRGSINYHSLNSTVPGWNTYSVAALVQRWSNGETANYGMRLQSGGANSQSVVFHSSGGTNRPEMQVTYISPTRYGLNGLWTYTNYEYGGGNVSYVNVASGNLVFQHRGGSIPARGFDVDLTHTYNSQDATSGAYGERWTFSHDLRLFEVDNGNAVVFKDGTGDESRVFIKTSDSGGIRDYSAPLNYGFELTKELNPSYIERTYTLTATDGGMKFYFDDTGRITRREDRNSNLLEYRYDTNSRIDRITDMAGRHTSLEYNGTGGRLSKITDMAGRVSTYAYDSAGNLTTIKHAVGTVDEVTTTLTYSSVVGNHLTRVTSPQNVAGGVKHHITYQSSKYNWDDAGILQSWTPTDNLTTLAQSTTRAYNGTGSMQMDVVVSSTHQRAGAHRVFSPIESWSSVRQELLAFVYLPTGAPTDLKARIGLWDRYTSTTGAASTSAVAGTLVPGHWNAIRLSDAPIDANAGISKMSIEVEYGATAYTGSVWVDYVTTRGMVLNLSDGETSADTVVNFEFLWDTKTTKVRRPDDAGTFRNTTYIYRAGGEVKSVQDPLGNTTEQTRDSLLRLTDLKLPGGTQSSYTYSYYPNSNQMQTWSNELGETGRRGADVNNYGDTRYTIDPLNEQRRTSNSTYEATVLTRDSAGNVTTIKDNRYAAGANLENNPLPTAQLNLRTRSLTYGTGGVITSMTDARYQTTNFTYQTGTGYLTQIDAPAGSGEISRRVWTITPNTDGTTQKVVDPKGQTTTYEYDNLGRLRKINYGVVNGVPAFWVSYDLDKNGNMTAMTDKTGSTSWVYNENNQLTSESRTQNSVTKTVQYTYYTHGELQTMTTVNNETVYFGYDWALRPISQTDPKNGGQAITFGYDDHSHREYVAYPSGVREEMTYDEAHRVDVIRLKKSDGTVLQSFDYDYGFTGTTRDADYHGGNVVGVTELDGSTESYTYDDFNRLETATRTGTNPFTQSYGYDGNNNRTTITNNGVTKYAVYDNANQMNSLGSTNYSYDRNGNMTAYGSNSLTYDASNKWTSGTVAGVALTFGYDGHGRRVSRTVNGSANRTDFWYDMTGLTRETGAYDATYLRDPDGLLLSKFGSSISNYGRNRLGSITMMTDSTQTVVRTYKYDPWGETLATTGTVYNPFRYAGSYQDVDTSLYQMGARYYQPGSGRFTQLDPLPSSVVTLNRYAYAGCNPTNFIDPSGLSHCSPETWIAVTVNLVAAEIAMAAAAVAMALAPAVTPLLLAAYLSAGGWYISALAAVMDCAMN